jgi:hypothetical protein
MRAFANVPQQAMAPAAIGPGRRLPVETERCWTAADQVLARP